MPDRFAIRRDYGDTGDRLSVELLPMSVTQLKTSRESEEWQVRVDLAAAFRLTVEMNWHEGVGNHFSAAVSANRLC
mgnify:CR=1 FL=1